MSAFVCGDLSGARLEDISAISHSGSASDLQLKTVINPQIKFSNHKCFCERKSSSQTNKKRRGKKLKSQESPRVRTEHCVWAGTVTGFNLGRRIGAKFETFGANENQSRNNLFPFLQDTHMT